VPSASQREISFKPIGIIHSPFHNLEDMPIQPSCNTSQAGTVEIYSEYADGLKDLEGFSHIYLLYHFHMMKAPKLLVIPFLDTELRGIFATRAPSRPNPIGLSLVRMLRIEGNLIHIDRLDILDETPLLDIKPYVPDFEDVQVIRLGWLERTKGKTRSGKSDSRFIE
jgi:tRNA-Thr(GGU) m(6)t(6)A37 methyltransferase TsaA